MQENVCKEFCSGNRESLKTRRINKAQVSLQNNLTLLLMKPKEGGASQSTDDASNFKELYSKDNSISPVPSLYFSPSVSW
jgi:hypothetical protein